MQKDMPEDFYPDEVIVIGKYNGVELGFAITRENWSNGWIKDIIDANLDALRRALWLEVNVNANQTEEMASTSQENS